MELFLGIDTSYYTTSLALIDGEGNLIFHGKKLLEVPLGSRGLAQHEAVFQHIKNLPELFEEAGKNADLKLIKGVSASTRPRPVQGSYMPVFKVGEAFARALAAANTIPFFKTSHQEGHIAAGIYSAGGPMQKDFLAIHMSGGTTEILDVFEVSPPGEEVFEIKLLGGTTDLHAGQLIDRIGVKMGLPFPAGPELERLAQESVSEISLSSSVKGYDVSFSGPEAQALRLIEQNKPFAEVARAVEKCIATTIEKIARKAVTELGKKDVLVVGGVSSNMYIRQRLIKRLEHKSIGANLFFASKELSRDNAVGVAWICHKLNKFKCG